MKIHLIWIMCIDFFSTENGNEATYFVHISFWHSVYFGLKKIFLPLSKWKMSQIKIANFRDSWILSLHSSQLADCFPRFPSFQKCQKHLFRETIALSSLPLAPVTLEGTPTPQALSGCSEKHAQSLFLAHWDSGWSVCSFLGASIIDMAK